MQIFKLFELENIFQNLKYLKNYNAYWVWTTTPLFPHYNMALIRYFKRDSAGTFLPDPKGPLSTSLSSGNIKAAKKAVL